MILITNASTRHSVMFVARKVVHGSTVYGAKDGIHVYNEYEILTGLMKRIPIVQDRQPQGCGSRAYMDVFTACLEQWVSFSSVLVITGLSHLLDRFRPTIHLTWARRNDDIKNIKPGITP